MSRFIPKRSSKKTPQIESSTIGAMVRSGLKAGAPAGLTVSGTISPLKATASRASAQRIAETRRGVRDFAKELLTLLKGSESAKSIEGSPSSAHAVFTLSLNPMHLEEEEMDIPEELDLSGEDDALSQDQLDVLGERQDIEVYTDTGTKLSMRSLLDTGSVVNTIRHELVLDSGHAIEPYDGREVVGFNGTSFMPKGKVVVRLHFTDSAKALRTWKVTFLIVPDTCPCDVVFGRGFIERSNFYKFHGENLVLEFAKESKEQKAERVRKVREAAERNKRIAAQESEQKRQKREASRQEASSSANGNQQGGGNKK